MVASLAFTMERNTPVSSQDVRRCNALIDDLRRISAGVPTTATWIGIDGGQIYGRSEAVIDEAFLKTLRFRCPFFTGYDLRYLTANDFGAAHENPDGLTWRADPVWTVKTFAEYIENLPERYVCRAPLKMGEIGMDYRGICVNNDILSYQERMTLLHAYGILDRASRIPDLRIMEIGGGYGALAYFLTNALPDATYIIVDLPQSLVYSVCYLAVTQPHRRLRVSDTLAIDPEPGSIVFVPHLFARSDSEGPALDLAINTMSMAEMPADIVNSYGRLLRRLLRPRAGVLFEQNFSNDGIGDNFCDPERILKRHFSFQLRCRAHTRWGRASVWTDADFFMPGFAWPSPMLGALEQD